uniref:COX assembly mitochondrial protein n=1 Tax=Macrostomum lignano TaxID=282301 RepID=A0A1I8FN02_9PLAT
MLTQTTRTTTLSRDTYFFITEDVQDRLRLAEKRQVNLSSEGEDSAPSAGRPQSHSLADSVADSIRQTQQLDQLQRDYESRLAKLEERSQARFQSAAVLGGSQSVESKFIDREAPPPCCQAEKEAVRQCYAANVRYPLRCSQMVAAFEQCVTEQRRAFVIRQRKSETAKEAGYM